MRTARLALFCLLAGALPALAAQPRVANARLQERLAAQGLAREVQSIVAAEREAAWIGYAVPAIPGAGHTCCSDGDWRGPSSCGCHLEDSRGSFNTEQGDSGPVKLEGGNRVLVLLRVENGRIGKVRAFSEDCPLDAGGRPFYWLTGARPDDSVSLLASLVSGQAAGDAAERGDRAWHGAVMAIAFHADQAASRALDRFIAPGQPAPLRKQAAFWLGSARGREGLEVLRRLVREDPDPSFRKEVVFPISLSHEREAIETLIQVAHDDKSAEVRGQALFWLAQKAGRQTAAAIGDAIANDPDTEVKKHAVFALSQLPKDEGVPKLIEVARTNRNPAVRKQAIFWLGQSKDPRALAFFQEVLLGR
jgi:hypothetical protein